MGRYLGPYKNFGPLSMGSYLDLYIIDLLESRVDSTGSAI